jgi:hypothetical protein
MLRSRNGQMNITRAVVLGVVGGALAAWLATASTSGTRQLAPIQPARVPPVDKSGAELAAEIGRLHDRLRPTTAPAAPARDLFEFSAARIPRAGAAEPLAVIAAPVPVPQAPRFSLIGVAEDGGVRTAIVSGPGDVFLVKEGDRVADRYIVVRVDADAVELTDISVASDSRSVRLALK